jgi:arylsulfatase A-like enzyme
MIKPAWLAALYVWIGSGIACGREAPAVIAPQVPAGRSVIIVVWDGMRPDAVSAADTPNLLRLRDAGVELTDHHATYPTFTMMNAASFASGAFPDATGFYGNVVWQPAAIGHDSAGRPMDFRQPVFSEDYAVLDALKLARPQLLLVDTLFEAAHAAGLATATVGKTGAAYLQDNARGGLVFDERTVIPLGFARELQAAGVALPATAPTTYAAGELVLGDRNGNPTEIPPPHRLGDGVSTDPTDDGGSPSKAVIDHLVSAYLDHVLPDKQPRLSVVWLRDPDTTQHSYGVGTANWRDAVHNADRQLGRLIDKLAALGRTATTDIIVVSDHGHSNVSGPTELFPLRAVQGGEVGDIDPHGHAVSGMVRIVDPLRRAGFTAFDGLGCTWLPVAGGLRRDGSPIYPTHTDVDGSICGKPGQRYQLPPSKVPAELPAGAIVVAVNGGSDYLYVPDHDAAVVGRAVRFLQERAEVGAVFVDDRYGALPGTLPLGLIHAKNAAGRNPDIIFSYDFDPAAVIAGMPGTEMAGVLGGNSYRGMHGSFSPRDVHNLLIASGPDFRAGFRDPLPTGNVDLAPTVAHLLGLALPRALGRPLFEAMVGGAAVDAYRVVPGVARPAAPATGLTVRLPTDPDGKDVAANLHTYSFELHTKALVSGGRTYTYFDFAQATRR